MKKLAVLVTLFLCANTFAAERGTAVRGVAQNSNQKTVVSARAASTSKVMVSGPAKTQGSNANIDISGDPCKQSYWGCMDSFCMSSNDNGARCACSNDSIKLDKEYNQIMDIPAMITDDSECADDDIGCHVGAAKYSLAAKLCETKVPAECKASFSFAKLQYSQNIRNDCAAYTVAIKNLKDKKEIASAAQRQDDRNAASDAFNAKNTLDLSACAIEFKSCMNGLDVCGKDWSRCSETNITDKRFICEKILNNCDAVREDVWNGFMAEIAPTLKNVAITAENNDRQSCISDISDCILKACRDNITGLGETMDGCLSRPEMVQSFCKTNLDKCETDGSLWAFVKQKLMGMRADRCTTEVKECITNENACGKDFSNCIGMDKEQVYKLCSTDKLVVCKQDKTDFSITDLGPMVDGIMASFENQILDTCKNLANDKMTEICGDALNCTKPFEKYNKKSFSDAVNFTVVGISDGTEFAACKNKNPNDQCQDLPHAGELLIDDYIKANPNDGENARVDLESAQNKINIVIDLLEKDQKVSWCIGGRDLSQISGKAISTMAIDPTMTETMRKIIALSALKEFQK